MAWHVRGAQPIIPPIGGVLVCSTVVPQCCMLAEDLHVEFISLKKSLFCQQRKWPEALFSYVFLDREEYLLCVYSGNTVQTASSNGHEEGLNLCQLNICDLAGWE